MNGFPLNAVSGSSATASTNVATALVPKRHTSTGAAKAKDASGANNNQDSSPGSGTTGDITSSDFLSLLVSELKNQDPTQPTDPNAYITQLVGVNSLQQLIQINSGLTNIETSSTASSGTTGS